MERGYFYFIDEDYFEHFKDPYLMRNKEAVDGLLHDRPCFYAFEDKKTGLFWMIPFSSRVEKYRGEYEKKVEKYGWCDTIAFGKVLGYEKAFLIQNMCPITQDYMRNIYLDAQSRKPVRLAWDEEKEVQKKARKVLALTRSGRKLIFPNVMKIERELLKG